MGAKRILSKLSAFSKTRRLLSPPDRVLAAVSGGADSVCLAHWLAGLRGKGRLRGLALVHFHHGLRGKAADKDEAFVSALAGRLGTEYFSERLAVRGTAKAERRGLEDAGRALRYRAMARLAREHGFTKVALGHHLDDHVETVLLHLLRGTTAKGLMGIPPSRELEGCKALVVRPLLGITREETRAYCREFGLRWREDASNRDEDFTRNWVRRRLVPLLERKKPGVSERISRISAAIRRMARFQGPNSVRTES